MIFSEVSKVEVVNLLPMCWEDKGLRRFSLLQAVCSLVACHLTCIPGKSSFLPSWLLESREAFLLSGSMRKSSQNGGCPDSSYPNVHPTLELTAQWGEKADALEKSLIKM